MKRLAEELKPYIEGKDSNMRSSVDVLKFQRSWATQLESLHYDNCPPWTEIHNITNQRGSCSGKSKKEIIQHMAFLSVWERLMKHIFKLSNHKKILRTTLIEKVRTHWMCEQHVTINIVLRMLLWSGLEVCRMQGSSHIPVWMSLEKWQNIPMSTKPSTLWGPSSCFSVRRFSNQQEQYYSMTLCQSRIVIENVLLVS